MTEAVEIFDLDFGSKLLGTFETDADVSVAAELAFLHVAGGNTDELDGLLELCQVGVGLIGAAHVGLADDFDQGSTGTIEINVAVFFRIFEAVV